ncbi:surface-adhesin E family protein [Flavobacterium lindanitolerans]|uniref:Surface-adhesin protein E-like domain-containing protein n=1 Tax=Flavobacterium lindanitolerans TaxID=428988 RepID=A0A497UYC8_9FLAO|nr:surface-adhesin E family protein [Flavobacterium lindanitolerans]MBC8643728.1 hypothetical protein [Flavobacterium lindanitolerans]PKW28465.1 hypothetical protein B0G92_0085 [Flavobacterium lindanitolerans]RLJ36030.1 hypothetical protein CLV50_1419 [Flavobacterium lindanitolerans]
MKVFYLLLLFSFTTYSQTKFELIATSGDNTKYYVKIESTNLDNMAKTIWLKIEKSPKKIKSKSNKIAYHSQGYTLYYMTMYCHDRKYDNPEIYFYDGKGRLIEKNEILIYNANIVPDTIIETVYDYVCD